MTSISTIWEINHSMVYMLFFTIISSGIAYYIAMQGYDAVFATTMLPYAW